jgi:RNA polymerase sigma-70 factor (ECF subfamily)
MHGAAAVGRMLAGFARAGARRNVAIEPAEVNGGAGLVAFEDGALIAVWSLELSGGAVQAIRGIVNPDKLRHLAAA